MLLFVDNLTNVDFSYLHTERGMLGETWLASASLEGALDEQGMVCDFGEVKRLLRHFLDKELDHCLLVPTLAPNLTLEQQDGQVNLTWTYGANKQLTCKSPAQAIALINAPTITPESVAKWCIDKLKQQFADSVARLDIRFAEEAIDGAFYHYSHGLKKHAGNCQRIAHGHRSRINIWLDGAKAVHLEADWAKRWEDIYLGSDEDLIKGDQQLHFAYVSAQGPFELTMPKSQCEMINTDTTVEWLARYIANTLAQQNPGKSVRVQAFEGLHKGAIAEAKI
ncbi:6-carboxytetrahydropterin synthase [Simiduia curdlanivorans]|uniref:6-carboxy-5,6,7,8-tetrahydropterin synthase n=1 Tax=Simiduia curdlanivorans TaxID=1492769 RepID=A0ABV8V9K2_9GAMM|nr:6-carboxytetrahydropterin synthase [Simiduia curdlanivorans]MDN3639314.1 6-carboxytetrahydropterin synthase [Simiduia curdlanivorans]